MNYRTRLRTVLLATSLMSLAAPAFAQQAHAQTEAEVSHGDDVVVVARRREERLQDVPLAVTALPESLLQDNNINRVDEISNYVPGFNASSGTGGGGRAFAIFSIRGQSQQESFGLSDGSVQVYFGDVVQARTQGINQALFDIRAIEVLKGPQGTLFGRNSTGGAVVIRPQLPSDVFEGNIGVTLDEHETTNVDGYVNIPLGDSAALRLAGGFNQSDGYIYDVNLGRNVDYIDNWAGRATLSMDLTPNLNNILMVNHFEEDDGGPGAYVRNVNPAGGSFDSPAARAARNYTQTLAQMLADQDARSPYEIASGLPVFTRIDSWDVHNTTTWDFSDNITLKNIVGYRTVDSHVLNDLDGLPIPLLHSERIESAEQWSEEFQILGDHGNLNWIVGAYYFTENGETIAPSITGGVDQGLVEIADLANHPNATTNWNQYDNTSYALFAQGTYAISDQLSFTLGLRQNWDTREATILNRSQTACRFTRDLDNNPATPETAAGLANCRLDLEQEFDALTYNVSLDYKPNDDTLLYLTTRRGYRSGGFASRAASEEGMRRFFVPEFVDDVELGLKRDWDINGAFLRTNIAAFYAQYTDIQRYLVDFTLPVPTSVTVNAAEATVHGFEAELLFRPVDVLEINASYSALQTGFDEFINPTNGQDLSGYPFARAPTFSWSLGATLNVLESASLGDVSVSARFFERDGYSANDDYVRIASDMPGYNQTDFNVNWDHLFGSRVDANFFVRNAFENEQHSAMAQVYSSLGFVAVTPGEPRTVGVSLRYSFGE
ncbi:MAG: TonB-dependent receptor [Caulobacterales bacterium]|nr:TonB-dependent receptor [Caulobacterales bacterium]